MVQEQDAGCITWHLHTGSRDSRKWAPMTCFFQQCAFSYRVHSFPNSTTDWGPSILMHEPMGTFVIQISRVLPRDQGQGIMKGHTPALGMGSSSVFMGWFFYHSLSLLLRWEILSICFPFGGEEALRYCSDDLNVDCSPWADWWSSCFIYALFK